MTKADIVDLIAEKLKETKRDIAPIVEAVFDCIGESLVKEEKCTFADFGVFEVKERAAREGRNPQDPTKIVQISKRKVPVFRPGKKLKEKVNHL